MQKDATPKKQIKKWKRLNSSLVITRPRFRVRQDDVQLPSGKIIEGYFVWDSPTIATVVPITADGKFVLCQQYRYGVDKIMYQFPAGGVDEDKGESPEAAARRELKEETGYVADQLEPLGTSAAYPTKLSGWHHLYLARDVQPTGTKHEDEHEPTRVVLKTPEELWGLIHANEFQVADSLVAALLALRRLGY